jgi:hypothetical protein
LTKRKYEQLDKFVHKFLEDRIFDYLLARGTPALASEIRDALDLAHTPDIRVVRQTLANSERFARAERGWRLAVHSIPRSTPVAKAVEMVVQHYGRPCTTEEIAEALSASTGFSQDHYLGMISEVLGSARGLVDVPGLGLVNASWLLALGPRAEDDVRFLNRTRGQAEPGKLVTKLLRLTELPISNKIVGFLEWRSRDGAFDPVEHIAEIAKEGELRLLSSGHWYDRSVGRALEERLGKVKVFGDLEEAAEEPEQAITIDDVVISDQDIEQIANLIAAGERGVPCQVILERLYDVTPQDAVYEKACAKINKTVRRRSRFQEVGHHLWQLASRIPDRVRTVPGVLGFEKVKIEPLAGEIIDPELKVEGLEGDLAEAVRATLLGDVDDTIGVKPPEPENGRYRIVTKYHHAQAGTLPLCHVPDEFFPEGHSLVESALVVLDERGGERRRLVDVGCWVNRDTGLIYDLRRLYDQGVSKTGTVMYLEEGRQPNSWHIILTSSVDPDYHVGPKRISELEEIRRESEEGDPLSLFEIVCRIMAHYSSGVSFPLLHTEVGIVRRTKRHPLASILSAYYCFYQKEPGSEIWQFDERKVDQGFKKAKRKYLKKR